GRQDRAVALVDAVAHRLPDLVVRHGEGGEAVVEEDLPAARAVGLAAGGLFDVEVVAPAGELEAVIAHLPRERGEIGQRKVGPLAGEQRDGTWHGTRMGT